MSRFDVALFASLAFVCACAPPDNTGPDSGEVIKFACDFTSYESWQPSFHFDAVADASAPDLDGGSCATPHNFTVPRDVYFNGAPPSGSTKFPVGTTAIKEARVTDDPSTWQIYAMVKRDDGSYNPGSGCEGWEWFELKPMATACPSIQWRGPTPPAGSYGNCPSCTSCHASSPQNDCIWGVPLSDF
jgi:hypothetical protein